MTDEEFLQNEIQQTLASYRAKPSLVAEHVRLEEQAAKGGYAHRQIYEVVQNGADQIKREQPGRITVILSDHFLYCANEGAPFSQEGIQFLLQYGLSTKRGDEIGHFGIGFKSLLGVSSEPQVFTDSISFAFNPPQFADDVRAILANKDAAVPKMRGAALMDRRREVSEDPILGDLVPKFTTVIRAPLIVGVRPHLAKDIANFPAEFLLFCPHVTELVLWDRQSEPRRLTLTGRRRYRLTDDDHVQDWMVFRKPVPASELPDEARQDVDQLVAQRKQFDMYWAVPIKGAKRHIGQFWAFFPTKTEVTLQGILNAPWKTNSDRENLLAGPFNDWLLEHASTLICSHLSALNTVADPARFLDALPSRHTKNEFDRSLEERVISTLKKSQCIPASQKSWTESDSTKSEPAAVTLQYPSASTLLPDCHNEPPIASWISQHSDLLSETIAHKFVHARRPTALRLGCTQLTGADLLRSIQEKCKTSDDALAAIRLAKGLLEYAWNERDAVKAKLKVLTTNDEWVYPDKMELAFASPACATASQMQLVHATVAADKEAREFLTKQFGIEAISREVEFRAHWAGHHGGPAFWNQFWNLIRGLDIEFVHATIDAAINVKTLAGTFQELGDVLLPGRQFSGRENAPIDRFVIDKNFHKEDLTLLAKCEASDVPRALSPGNTSAAGTNSQLPFMHLKAARDVFMRECVNRPGQRQPRNSSSAEFNATKRTRIGPIEPLTSLTGDEAVKFTAFLVECALGAEVDWTVVHSTRPDTYPHVAFPSLATWVIRTYGWVDTSRGSVKCTQAVSNTFRGLSHFFPVVSVRSSREIAVLGLPDKVPTLREEHWKSAMERALLFKEVDPQPLVAFYAWVAECKRSKPTTLRCLIGEQWAIASVASIRLTDDSATRQRLIQEKIPHRFSQVPRDVQRVVDRGWLKKEVAWDLKFDAAGEPELAIERFPSLQDVPTFPKKLKLQSCYSLLQEHRDSKSGLETRTIEAESLLRDDCLYFLDERDSRWVLECVLSHIRNIPVTVQESLLKSVGDAQFQKAMLAIRECTSLEEKLFLAIGEEALRGGIDRRHLRRYDEMGKLDKERLAKLAHAIHGVDILKFYADDLRKRGFPAPTRWGGGAKALAFVRELGIDDDYAGLPFSERLPFEDVLGPVTLGDLHDYQEQMRDEILSALGAEKPSRGMLCLPTGAGKTRVAVQSIVEWFKEAPSVARSALWIAQSDELCEQAVQCWLQVWRACGPNDQKLRVNRLWGSTNERVHEPRGGFGLVVASYQSLVKRIDRSEMDWLFNPDVVVIDEAHGATAASYTAILARLGLKGKTTVRPLIGLSATPFRGGTDESDSLWLAFRFDRRRFDQVFAEDAAELYRKLQRQKVLALVNHAALPGEEIVLTENERDELAATPNWLPRTVESRLAVDQSRNDRILAHIGEQPADWPILVFAISVEHAEDLAVQLSMSGISARSISGETSADARRHTIAAFNRGELRVLTNYGVLTTGFDAPQVRAVYITRPVFSKVLYQQMIGRGLRGPLNRGKERCLVVNIADNIREYGQQLAFREFEHVWQR